jgi:hypothetical protein
MPGQMMGAHMGGNFPGPNQQGMQGPQGFAGGPNFDNSQQQQQRTMMDSNANAQQGGGQFGQMVPGSASSNSNVNANGSNNLNNIAGSTANNNNNNNNINNVDSINGGGELFNSGHGQNGLSGEGGQDTFQQQNFPQPGNINNSNNGSANGNI